MRVLRSIFFLSLFLAAFSACQKEDGKPTGTLKSALNTDSVNTLDINGPGTFLATKGTLKITLDDSTYIFDAATDSIAFVNVALESEKYFGITAINKAHTLSFGISAAGLAKADTNATIAGTQLLYNADDEVPLQYTLSKYISTKDMGKINLIKYQQDSTLTQGTFYTILSQHGKPSSYYKATGTFNLLLK